MAESAYGVSARKQAELLEQVLANLVEEEAYAAAQILGAPTALARQRYACQQAALRVDVQCVRKLMRRHEERSRSELEARQCSATPPAGEHARR